MAAEGLGVTPILFLDANTIWHRKFAEAVARRTNLVAINPRPGAVPKVSRDTTDAMRVLDVVLPRGWASSTAFVGQRILARIVRRAADSLGAEPVIVLTSPAYAELARRLGGQFVIISYTADDYRNYSGWGGMRVVAKERAVLCAASLSVFVSEALRDRAVAEFGLDRDRTLVSPNATEPRFAGTAAATPARLEGRARPVVGILGGLSERLDLGLVDRVAASPAVGTFLVAGPASDRILAEYPRLAADKVVITGRLPHEQMHRYALAMDAALIPYARTELNHFCSPMRLYDHLATGVPIFAAQGCDQIDRATYDTVVVAPADRVPAAIEEVLAAGPSRQPFPEGCFWGDRAEAFLDALKQAYSQSL